MEMTRERISFTFDPRDMLLSLQMGFSFVRAAVACAILERTSGLEPSSETTAPRYLKLVTVPYFCPFTFISLWMPLALFVISLHRRRKRGGQGGPGPPNNLRGGANIPFGPPNNPPTFSFNFYVKQEKITNVSSRRVK